MRLNDPQDRLVPRSVRTVLTLVLSLGWLVPALLAWWLHAMGASSASDLSAVAWWWALVVAVAWALAGAVYLRHRIQQTRR